ncbi:MAG: archease [Chloroflexi bacterium]|nr:archease [Chloroflexota bacterium]
MWSAGAAYNSRVRSSRERVIETGFRMLEHTADAAIEATGKDLRQLFANAARGLFQVITELDSIGESLSRDVSADAADREALLVAWLNEFVYLFDVENILFRRFEIGELTETMVKGRAFGEPIDHGRHDLKTAIKSTTYHGLSITGGGDGYRARVIFDV